MIREGKISAVYPERHSARVVFEDRDNLVSAELPILNPCASKNRGYCLPDVGESVVCIFNPNAELEGTGFIIGSRYHEHVKPPANSQDVTRTEFADGTFLQYDRSKHELRIECVGKIIINGSEIRLNE